ncbi:MAG: TatD family hydrolase [Candidatus Omnitrophica bacterium]|nr:TatD family hydrolase [Candidatus Omnitrophota bacterium]
MMNSWIDTHTHLDFDDFRDDLKDVIGRAKAVGIQCMINVGADLASSEKSLRLTQLYDCLYATAGIHPHEAQAVTPEVILKIEEILQERHVVGIGEVGLDYFRDHSPREKQREVFGLFLEMHQKYSKPLVIHCREAYEDLQAMMKEYLMPPFQAISHCFSSDKDTMKDLLDLGFYIAFGGALTYKKNDVLREALKFCPLDRLLLETDAPYLPPQAFRGKRNEPAYLIETAKLAAEIKRIHSEELARHTTENAKKIFRL